MKYPNFNEEKKLRKQGFECIAGLDEAGRGPLAGPVVAGAVIIQNFQSIYNDPIFKEIKDSKQLSAKQREYIYKNLIKNKNIKWGIGIVSEKMIDKINILEATKLAIQKAITNLKCDYLLIDGNFKIKTNIPQRSIVKGDQKVMSIAMASIIAKVTRDRIMQKFHKKYPKYQFDKHKGYGTSLHIKMIKEFGACPIHRKTFRPITEIT
jgi:ribonuclease HII